jgi:hypothetical protein
VDSCTDRNAKHNFLSAKLSTGQRATQARCDREMDKYTDIQTYFPLLVLDNTPYSQGENNTNISPQYKGKIRIYKQLRN